MPISAQHETNGILLINVKMPTIVGILTFISSKNTISKSFKQEIFFFQYFSFYEQLKFHAVETSMKKVVCSRPVSSMFWSSFLVLCMAGIYKAP